MFNFLITFAAWLFIPVAGMYGLNHFFPVTVPINWDSYIALFLITIFIRG